MRIAKRMLLDQEGATLVEYGLLLALISITVVAAVVVTGRLVGGAFGKLPLEVAKRGARTF